MKPVVPPSHFIPYGRQCIDEADIRAVTDCLRGDWLTTGPDVDAFEDRLCTTTGADHAVALHSGTAALHAAYQAAGLGPGDEIITSPLTFAATANAALYLGADIRFVDIDADTGTLDPDGLEEAITDRTRLVAAVDYAGRPADYESIGTICDRWNLTLVADAAHSLGATYRGRPVGTLADLTTLSFHPVKPITSGEGGAVLTDHGEWAQNMAEFRTHGITRDRDKMRDFDGPWHYEMHELGYNYRITDLQCALGNSQLQKLDRLIDRRRTIAARYLDAFGDIDELRLPSTCSDSQSGWHLFVVRVQGDERRKPAFFKRLRHLNLGVQVHYRPVYLHPYYRDRGFEPGLCPRAEDFYRRAVSLPIFPAMKPEEVDAVIDRVHRAAEETLR